MNKILPFRLFASAIGILCLVSWTNPVPYEVLSSNLDEQEEIIRERIPTAVSIVNPVYNPAVRSYLDTYIYRRPQHTAAMLGWAAVYFPMFEKALAEAGLPTDLKYLSIVESALNPAAISRSGAGGLWQFMKPTAKECGLKISSYVDERMDPDKSTKAAVHYLKQLYSMFGNWELVMAAYNAGPGRVRAAVKRAGSSDYWKIARFLPEETRSYVPGFIAASYLMNFHDAHNIIPVYPEMAMGELTTIVIYKGMSIPEVAKRSGLSIELVKQLNPSFIRNYIPTSAAGHALVLPFASAELFNSGRSMDVPDIDLESDVETATVTIDGNMYKITTSSKDHIVRSGDNLSTIAERNNCTVRQLMTWNGLRDSRLAIGQRLEIRYTIKELIPSIVEIAAPALPARNAQKLDALTSLSFDYFPVDNRTTDVRFAIDPVIKEQSTNTLVLQRRQSVRQALNQYHPNSSLTLTTCYMPSSLVTGDVVRMK
jgi:membrane-bound lytic murein transglycosylase D